MPKIVSPPSIPQTEVLHYNSTRFDETGSYHIVAAAGAAAGVVVVMMMMMMMMWFVYYYYGKNPS